MENLHATALKEDYKKEFAKIMKQEDFDISTWLVEYDTLADIEAKRKSWPEDYSIFTRGKVVWNSGKSPGVVLRNPLAVILKKHSLPVSSLCFPAESKDFLVAGLILDPLLKRRELRNNLLTEIGRGCVYSISIAEYNYAFFHDILIRNDSDVIDYRGPNGDLYKLRDKIYANKHLTSFEIYNTNLGSMTRITQKARQYQTIVGTPEFSELESVCCNYKVSNILLGHSDLDTIPELVKHLNKVYKV